LTTITPLLLATRNQGKLRELGELLADLPLKLLTLGDFGQIIDVEETGRTFKENAVLKASGYASQTCALAISDDSGLEVDALGGAPGVRSARYVSGEASYSTRIERLLAEIAASGHADRTARFISAIAIADAEGKILNVSVGSCEGRIAFEPCGSHGFGYDPIFIPSGYELTFGELDSNTKNAISHRSKALRGARDFLTGLTGNSADR
jgi:XTP/dITP diphosphohydrolase